MALTNDDWINYPTFTPDVENYVQPYCKYVTVDGLSPFISSISLSILMLNIRSCKKNFDQFIANFSHILTYFSCILLTETWLTLDRDHVFGIPGFNCHNLYRDQYGGGIKLYVKSSIQTKILNDFTLINDMFEMLTVELLFCNHKLLLSTVYHRPTSCPMKNVCFVDSFTSYLRLLINHKIPLIVAGDLNLNLLNPNNYIYVDLYIRNLFELGMAPLVMILTKINPENLITKFSILDQIWVSDNVLPDKTFVIPVDITDHFCICTVIDISTAQSNHITPAKRRPFSARGKETFKTLLSNISVDTGVGDLNAIFNSYFMKVFRNYEVAFPIKAHLAKVKPPVPWLTVNLKQCIKKKSKLYRLYLKGRVSKDDYTVYKNRLTGAIRRSKVLYFAKLLLENANNPKLLWSNINSVLNKKSKRLLKEVKANGVVLTGVALADYVNDYFVNVAGSITSNLPLALRCTCLSVSVRESCFFYPATYVEVSGTIKGLKNRGSKLMDIHPSILKENADVFSQHIKVLYNISLTEAEYPNDLKIARVNPFHKSGQYDIIDNYRPISVLPVFSKIFEKLTYRRMENFIRKYKILTSCQFGFRKSSSTTHAIIRLLSNVVQAYHDKIYSVCFFLDLRKAFDTINHQIMLQKLKHYGFRGQCYKYLQSYFHNRKQYVHLDNNKSSLLPITHGVPQGSILGPLCFSLYINDLPLAVESSTVLFADDAAFVLTSDTLEGLYRKIRKLFF